MLLKVSGSGLSFFIWHWRVGKFVVMGNIHIFIPDGLHERLRRVCRHKVTQQKFLEEGIEKLVSEKEGHSVLCTEKKLKPFVASENLLEFARDLEALEKEVAVQGIPIPPQYYVPEGEAE